MGAWGLLADIHGNLAALERGLERLRTAGATRYAFLGDYLGRGDSEGCVRLIREVASAAVVGNRDLDWQDRVSPEARAWVRSLPCVACVDGLLIAHGDARLTPGLSTTEISRGLARVWRRLAAESAQVFAFGHSHHARMWRHLPRLGETERLDATEVALADAARYALNVGSTGLPFPGKGGPSVALLDFDAHKIRHVPIDVSDLGTPRQRAANQRVTYPAGDRLRLVSDV